LVYSTGESFAYVHDVLGNRTLVTSTTPLSGTVVTTYTYDAANRLTDQVRSDGRSYTYTWSNRNQLLAEWIPGVPLAVREFAYDGAGRMVQARVFTLTARFAYNGDGARRTVEVMGK
jgi:YD repeat-containing protein